MTAVIQDRATRRNLEVRAALIQWHTMNTDKQWARIIADEHLTIIEYGVIHSNGQHEAIIGSKLFVAKEDWIVVVESHHCG